MTAQTLARRRSYFFADLVCSHFMRAKSYPSFAVMRGYFREAGKLATKS